MESGPRREKETSGAAIRSLVVDYTADSSGVKDFL